jgi:chromatin structure-remodeling complex protein RSC7
MHEKQGMCELENDSPIGQDLSTNNDSSAFNAGINAIRKLNNAGVYDIHTNTMQYPASMQPTVARIEQISPQDQAAAKADPTFPPVPLKMARNFAVIDTYFETPAVGGAPAAVERSDPADFVAQFNGLGAVPDDIKDLLPAECREAFDKAVQKDMDWRSRWGLEATHMSRKDPIVDKAIVPYNMTG